MSTRDSDHNYSSGGAASEIVLFGVRVKVDPMRKCVSLNDLSRYAHRPHDADHLPSKLAADAAGYASADDADRHRASGSRERKRGIPWTEEEHKLFLLGLKNIGKGDWRGISRNFVKTRTPTQVASHAQKYFLRHSNLNKRRRRSSLFDITSESVAAAISMEEEKPGDNTNQLIQISPNEPLCKSESTTDLNSNTHHPIISLDLSLSSGHSHNHNHNHNLNNGKSIISVT